MLSGVRTINLGIPPLSENCVTVVLFAIAAAVVVTGGAAIGAFGGKLATTQFGSWMVGASQKVLGGTLFGGIKVRSYSSSIPS